MRAFPKTASAPGVTFAVMTLANLIARSTAQRTLARTGLSLNAWRMLRYASATTRPSASGAVTLLAMDKTTASRAVRELVKAGLIRLVPNPADRRQGLIRMTEAGRRLYRLTAPVDRAVDDSFERQLTAGERARLAPIFAKLHRHARSLLAEVDA